MNSFIATPSSQVKASATTSTSTVFYRSIEKKRAKPKKQDTDEQVKLLVRLVLPKRYQGGQNLVALLQEHLANLLPTSKLPELNFEIHVFIANLINRYVLSWYYKLNTDNFEFINNVYDTICVLLKDIFKRIGIAYNYDNLLPRLDEICGVLDAHLHALVGASQLKVLEDYYRKCRTTNLIVEEKCRNDIIHEYLQSQHVVFGESRALYFRMLVKKIIGELNSEIGVKFVDLVVADLVLVKITDKLASPDFLLSTIYKVVCAIKQRRTSKPKGPSWTSRLKLAISKGYKDLSYLFIANEASENFNILESQAFSLANTITGLSSRKPVLYDILTRVSTVIVSNSLLNNKINLIFKKFFIRSLVQSNALDDKSLSKVAKSLTDIVFGVLDSDEDKIEVTVELVVDEIYELVKGSASFRLQGESDQDIRDRIERMVEVFGDGDVNMLLVMRVLDTAVASLYPEFVEH